MIRKALKTAAALPVWIVGNAFMVPLLKDQLRREAAKVKSVTAERDAARTNLARLREEFNESMDSKVDRQCWTYGAGQQNAVEAVAKMLGCEAEIGAVEAAIRQKDSEIDGECMRADENAWHLERARRWASLWHERARAYRGAMNRCQDAEQAAYENCEATTAGLREDLARAEALIHPWYGPCDAFKDGECSECARLIAGKESGDDMVLRLRRERDEARAERDALRPKAEHYDVIAQELAHVHAVDLPDAHERRERAEQERDAAERMADRLRHGQDIEGDHVCPDSLRADEAERRYTALRSAVEKALACDEGWTETEAILRAGLAADKPLPVATANPCCPRHSAACGKTGCCWQCPSYWTGRPLVEGEKRELKAHCDRLTRELADADRDHDAALAELKARHREVLAERDATIRELRGRLGT